MSVRAVERPKTAPPLISMKKIAKIKTHFLPHLRCRSARVQPRAHLYGAHQYIFLTKEILFKYLIGNIAQKLAKIEFVENHVKMENFSNFSQNIENFQLF